MIQPVDDDDDYWPERCSGSEAEAEVLQEGLVAKDVRFRGEWIGTLAAKRPLQLLFVLFGKWEFTVH